MNRRGNVLDVIVIMAIIFFLACGMIFFIFLTKKVTVGLSATDSIVNVPTASAIVSGVDTNSPWVADFFVIMIMFGLPVLGCILAFFNDISPVWFWSMFGFTMLVIVLAGFFASGYNAYINSGDIVSMKTVMPMTNFIMSNYVAYAMFCVILLSFGVYAKTKSQQGYM